MAGNDEITLTFAGNVWIVAGISKECTWSHVHFHRLLS